MSAQLVLFVDCLIVFALFFNSGAYQYLKMWQDQSLVNKVPPYTPAWIFHLSKTGCVTKCLEIRDCSVLVYNNISLVCNLYTQTRMVTATSSVMTGSGWTFYHKNQRLCSSTDGFIYSLTVDRCIKMGLVKTTHSGAVSECQNDTAVLVKVDSQEMWLFVATNIGHNNLEHTYIQGTKDVGGIWRYDDGSVIPFLKWASGEPGNTPISIHLILWSNDAYLFHDVTGSFNYNYVCEIDLKQ